MTSHNTTHTNAAYTANNPGSSNKEIMSALGAQWSALSNEDKRPFVDEAAAAKRRQDPLIAEYRLANSDSNPSTPRAKKTKAGDQTRKKSGKKAKFEEGQDGQDDEGEDSGGGERQPSSVAKTKAPRAAASAMSYDDEDDEDDDMADMDVETQAPLAAKTKKAAQGSTSSSTTASKKKKPSETSRAPSASRGIKQDDLASDDDLLNTSMVPPELSAFPPDDAVAKDNEIVVILTPYRDFVSTQHQLLAQHERDLVQQICVYTTAFVEGTVKSIQKASASATPSGDSDSDADSLNLVTIATRQGRVFTILHVDYTSPLLTGDRFVILKSLFDSR